MSAPVMLLVPEAFLLRLLKVSRCMDALERAGIDNAEAYGEADFDRADGDAEVDLLKVKAAQASYRLAGSH